MMSSIIEFSDIVVQGTGFVAELAMELKKRNKVVFLGD